MKLDISQALKKRTAIQYPDIQATVSAAKSALKEYDTSAWQNYADENLPEKGIKLSSSDAELSPTIADNSQERVALRGKIIASFFEGKEAPEGKPSLIQTAGVPGTGKTTTIDEMFDNGELDRKNTVFIDINKCMSDMPEFAKHGKDTLYSSMVRHETSLITNTVVDIAMANKMNIVMETTGVGVKSTSAFIKKAKEQGYSTRYDVYFCKPENNLSRILTRFAEKGGAFPPVDYTLSRAKDVARDCEEIASSADTARFINTDEKKRKVAKIQKGKHSVIQDKEAWEQFRNMENDVNALAEKLGIKGVSNAVKSVRNDNTAQTVLTKKAVQSR